MFTTRKLFTAAAVLSLSLAGTAARADITGSVKLDGKAPDMPEINMKAVSECAKKHPQPVYEETVVTGDKGELANVVVSLKLDDPTALGGEIPKETAVIDQKGCQYFPHVLAVMVGQKMAVKNDDEFQHNVHSLAQQNPTFNFSQPNKDDGKAVDPPKTAETYRIKCDVHPWMGAWVVVFDHPFFAVTGEDGKFAIKGKVPAGDYTIVAWHEKYNTQEGKVHVDDSGNGTVDFTFKAEGAMNDKSTDDAKLASAKSASNEKALSCCGGDSKDADKKAGQVAEAGK